jgi:acetyl-CoA acyltransferase
VTGDDPLLMLTAVIPATRKVLDRAGLTPDDIGVFEVNEAFASVVLAWQRETGVGLDHVNVAGGAIALGHPLGASGTRLLSSLLGSMERRDARFGLQAMCEAGGLANATVLELCH